MLIRGVFNMRSIKDSERSFRAHANISRILWTLLIAGVLVYALNHHKDMVLDLALMQAETAYSKDMVYRDWMMGVGGIYVKSSQGIRPSRFLPWGEAGPLADAEGYTLLSASHINRLVHEFERARSGVTSHLTSLTPLNPDNIPDKWETEALRSIAGGRQAFWGARERNGDPYFTLIKPLKAEAQCIECHMGFDYKKGDIMGGLSISIPMGPLREASHPAKARLVLGLSIAWLLGLAFIHLRSRDMIEKTAVLIRSEEAARKAEQAALRASEAKSMFLSMVSHELRTPMNAIIGMTDLALDMSEDDEQQEYLSMSLEAGQGLVITLNELLDFSKAEAGLLDVEYAPYDLMEVLDSVLELFRHQVSALGLTLDAHMPGGFDTVSVGDSTRLRQVLVNLVGNALKFTSQGGISIDVSARECPAGSGGRYLCFMVSDTGVGIQPDMVDNIFSNFTQASEATYRKYGGTGLGLYICQVLVRLMGGEIWVDSHENVGSTFAFFIKADLSVR